MAESAEGRPPSNNGIYFYSFPSPVGKIYLKFNGNKLIKLSFSKQNIQRQNVSFNSERSKIARKKILDFLTGKSKKINLPLSLSGTPFQKKVWQAIAQIPYGKTLSYGEIAKRIGRPKAYRAVANACGANSLPLIVPCHRVIYQNGKIGGFSAHLHIKKFLLNLEQTR